MKSLVAVTTLVLLAVMVGCGGNSGNSASGIPVHFEVWGRLDNEGGETPQPQLTAIDKEAIKLSLEFWKPTMIGDSYYLRYIRHSKDPKCPNKGRAVIQLRQVSINIHPSKIDEASKLNGIEWEGIVKLRYEAGRFYVLERLARFNNSDPLAGIDTYDPPEAPDTKWSDWETASTAGSMSLKRVKGKWETSTRPILILWTKRQKSIFLGSEKFFSNKEVPHAAKTIYRDAESCRA